MYICCIDFSKYKINLCVFSLKNDYNDEVIVGAS